MNFMLQKYNQIDIQHAPDKTQIELSIVKSVFKSAMAPPFLVCAVLLFFGVSQLLSLITNHQSGISLMLIWTMFVLVFVLNLISRCTWLLYGKERLELFEHHLLLEKKFPYYLVYFNYVQCTQLDYSDIESIQYKIWQPKHYRDNLPKISDGQICIQTKQRRVYLGINLSESEAKIVMDAMQNKIVQSKEKRTAL